MPIQKKKCPKGLVRSSKTHRCVTRSTIAKQSHKKKSKKKSSKKIIKKSYKKKSPKKSKKKIVYVYKKKSPKKNHKHKNIVKSHSKKLPGFSPGFISRMSERLYVRNLN